MDINYDARTKLFSVYPTNYYSMNFSIGDNIIFNDGKNTRYVFVVDEYNGCKECIPEKVRGTRLCDACISNDVSLRLVDKTEVFIKPNSNERYAIRLDKIKSVICDKDLCPYYKDTCEDYYFDKNSNECIISKLVTI